MKVTKIFQKYIPKSPFFTKPKKYSNIHFSYKSEIFSIPTLFPQNPNPSTAIHFFSFLAYIIEEHIFREQIAMSTISFSILGGDLRQCYLAEYITNKGYNVTCFGTLPFSYASSHVTWADTLAEAVCHTDFILCPVPFSTNNNFINAPALAPIQLSFEELLQHISPGQQIIGGAIPAAFLLACREKQIPVWDFMTEETFLKDNASLTAEGLLAHLLDSTPFSLTGRKILLLGYGRCGTEIGRLLLHFDTDILAVEQDKTRRIAARMDGLSALKHYPDEAELSSFDMVINTIPASVLSKEQLALLPSHCHFFDIASAPFGIPKDILSDLKINYICCPGIPGKKMPQTAGEYIGKVILERMLSYGI